MAIYIRFENGKQAEVTELGKKPGEGWIKAPASFNWNKRYRLNDKGKVIAMSAKAIAREVLEQMKQQKKVEIMAQAGRFRTAVYPVGQSKNDEYRIKAEAARRLVELEKNKQTIGKTDPDYQLLSFEAEVREITPVKLAKQIVEKSNKTAVAVGMIAAFEAKGKKIIEQADEAVNLEKDLEILIEETREKLNLE